MEEKLKVVNLSINTNQFLIENLESLLESAKKGELLTFAGTGLMRDGSVATIKTIGDFADVFKLLGAITNLQIMVSDEID